MQAMHFNGSMSRLVRWLVTAFICALLLFWYTSPAFAAQGSDPTKGEERLTGIEKKAQEAVQQKPASLEQTEGGTNPGFDDIQGTADESKMYSPETSGGTGGSNRELRRGLGNRGRS